MYRCFECIPPLTSELFRYSDLNLLLMKRLPRYFVLILYYSVIHSFICLQACDLLQAKLQESFEINFTKFEVYSSRNIFSFPSSSSTPTVEPRVQPPLPHGFSVSPATEEDRDRRRELEKLREHFWLEKARCEALLQQSQDAEGLLEDMRKALFNFRLSTQVLDDRDVQPLLGSLSSMSQRHETLLANCRLANGEFLNWFHCSAWLVLICLWRVDQPHASHHISHHGYHNYRCPARSENLYHTTSPLFIFPYFTDWCVPPRRAATRSLDLLRHSA